MNTRKSAVAAKASVEAAGQAWRERLTAFTTWIGERVARVEPRRHLTHLISGMIAGLPRVNCWTIAEHTGEAAPRGLQRLLSSAVVDTDGLAADLRAYVVTALGDPGGVLIVDETGDVKKGTATVGVAPQYTGTAGRVVNCQVAVYLAYATTKGYAFLDRALYLPKRWTDNTDRCAGAGVPTDVAFATKPALAQRLITTTLTAGTPARWVAADEVYGADPHLRAAIATAGLGYVLAVARTHLVATALGSRRVIDLASRPDLVWNRLPAGHGTKGPRLFDWALIDLPPAPPAPDPDPDPDAQACIAEVGPASGAYDGLLIRRTTSDGDLTFYRVHAPTPTPLTAFVHVAGLRWRIEEGFASAKELTGLDEHQVRSWTSWHRWTLIAMLAHAFLSVTAISLAADHDDPDLVPITRNELRHLLAITLITATTSAFRIAWSHWRRHHQAIARAARARTEPP